MHLNRHTLTSLSGVSKLLVPDPALLRLPERVLQFGTGVLLRGLPDQLIDEANRQGFFNGRIVVVKSTGSDIADFEAQDSLYTLCIRGIRQGEMLSEDRVIPVISRVIPAMTGWADILELAASKELQVILSNTTEVGIRYQAELVQEGVPESYPGKLLAFLYRRYQVSGGSAGAGLVIIPTELIPDNATRLLDVLLRLCAYNHFPDAFNDWLRSANHFCNSLVDRIVPGKIPAHREHEIRERLGYEDQLRIMSEAYGLWAIETDSEEVRNVLSFALPGSGIVLAKDISRFRTLKLRLLNGSHSFCCALALLSGFETVREAMSQPAFEEYIRALMIEEIVPAITGDAEDPSAPGTEEAIRFAEETLDRYRNPFLEHAWTSIALQYTSKMLLRNIPLIRVFTSRTGKCPRLMARGFGAYLVLMFNEDRLPCKLTDEHASVFARIRASVSNDAPGLPGSRPLTGEHLRDHTNTETLIHSALATLEIWGTDLNLLPDFTDAVTAGFREFEHSSFLKESA